MIELKKVSKVYTVGTQEVKALDNVSFTIKKGEFTVILGPSGSGKSTLLNLLGGMDRLSQGSFYFEQQDITSLTDFQLSVYRRDIVGFVFQFYNLIPSLTAIENIAIAAQLTNNEEQASYFLEKVGLSHRRDNFPGQLSGGEMQRVSIARALAKSPELLLCDEPTGALDSTTGLKVLGILRAAITNTKTAVVMVTHNAEFAEIAHQVIRLHDGKVESITRNDTPSNVQEVNPHELS